MAERDELRSARLLAGVDVDPALLRAKAVRAALRSRPWPPAPVRFAQRVRRKLGGLDYEPSVAEPMQAARRALLGGEEADGPPRFLVRVDEYPHYLAWDDPGRYGTEAFRRFHDVMTGAGVPYLIAGLPRLSSRPLDPTESRWRPLQDDERETLWALGGDGVTIGLHGLDHRTRFASPRRHSELCGLGRAATEELIETGMAVLGELGIEPRVFVPPFNRFDASQYDVLARRFDVVCGGPESVGLIGFQQTPLWRGEAVYLPAYQPLYGHARDVVGAARRLIERRTGLWTPIVLHWGWEADAGWSELEELAALIAPFTARWEDFLAAIEESAAA